VRTFAYRLAASPVSCRRNKNREEVPKTNNGVSIPGKSRETIHGSRPMTSGSSGEGEGLGRGAGAAATRDFPSLGPPSSGDGFILARTRNRNVFSRDVRSRARMRDRISGSRLVSAAAEKGFYVKDPSVAQAIRSSRVIVSSSRSMID